jgi:hypothetical protein
VGKPMDWKPWLAYITGSVDQELLVRNDYLITENRILRQQLTGCERLSDGERKALGERGTKLGKKALEEVATSVTLDTIIRRGQRERWYVAICESQTMVIQRSMMMGGPEKTPVWRKRRDVTHLD